MLVADNISYQPRSRFPDPAAAAFDEIHDSFVLTRTAIDICSRILQRLAVVPNSELRPLLLAGCAGAGKTHLLRYLAGLLENPADSGWQALIPNLGEGARQEKLRSRIITVPADPDVSLGRYLLQKLAGDTAAASLERNPPDEFASLARGAAETCASSDTALVILDDVSRRIDRITGEKQLQEEMQLYGILVEALAGRGVLPVLAGEERHFRRAEGCAQDPAPLILIGPSFDFIFLGRDNITEILNSVLVRKEARQKDAVRALLDIIRRRLPSFEAAEETCVDLYPIHPFVFAALFQLREVLTGFSPLHFIQAEVPRALGSPAGQLITPDRLFDFSLADLRKQQKFQSVLASYDSFRTIVLPRFKPGVRQKVEALLKVIALSTICTGPSPDVKSLAHSLLLWEDSDFLPSYSLISTLLMEMEQKGGSYLIVEGEKLNRSYRLSDLTNTPVFIPTRDLVEGAEEFRHRFPQLLYDWIHSEISAWKPDVGSRYELSSQSLEVQLPEGEKRLAGLVYFKSEHDPFWTEEDFQVLEASRYYWILLILSPLESSNDSDDSLKEFASRLARVLIWRPDRPTMSEVGRLQELSSRHPALGSASAFETSAGARVQTRRILRRLYVDRGQLINSEDLWSIGGEIESRSLSKYLSAHLSALAATESELPPDLPPAREVADIENKDRMQIIAASLVGLDEDRVGDSQLVRNRLLEWWTGVKETEAALLSTKSESLPDSLMTTSFWNEVKPVRNHLQTVKPCFECLRSAEAPLSDSLAEVLRSFGGERERLLEWRDRLIDLAGLARWLPGYEHTKDYVLAAFPLGQNVLDQLRAHLLELISQPHRFIKAAEREKYDREFLEFKRGYIDYYQSVHEEALNLLSDSKEAERKVDARALQNLELLSNLLYTNKSFLNRVRILGKWILHNQCPLPVREILERYPRCYCNFNPAGNRELAESAAQINGMIHEGIEYFRDALRKCSLVVIEDVKSFKVDVFHARQIAALLSHGPLDSLKPRTVEILNKIIERHSSDFLIALRS